MSIILFIIILSVLIFVHELGHFLFAKWSKMRVDEFAIGFPPKIVSYKKGETTYALNSIPFGGYVKIFGENPDEESLDKEATNSFVNKNKWQQAAVLIAGVLFNIIFAWILFSISFMIGFPTVQTEENKHLIEETNLVITSVAPGSPADKSGLRVGDNIKELGIVGTENSFSNPVTQPEEVQEFVKNNQDGEISISVVSESGVSEIKNIIPEDGFVSGQKAVGISMGLVGDLQYGFFQSFYEGFKSTIRVIEQVTVGLIGFLGDVFTANANIKQVSGPVGIVSMVGNVSQSGFIYVLIFTAFISVNLAVLNILPFPALDGGRLLFLLIEGITRKQIPVKFANAANGIGFILLIGLMVVITVSDVIKLF